MTVTATEKRTAANLLRDYDGLAGHLLRLTSREQSVINDLNEALTTGDPRKLDAALRAVIQTAQNARKSIKAGPPATATTNGIRVDDDVDIPWGDDEWRCGKVTDLSRDGGQALVQCRNTSQWVDADQMRKR